MQEYRQENTSLPSSSTSPDPAVKKTRRQTAFYPNINSTNKIEKPFSKSAAKRDSVLALGSIEHLQHYFTKTGLAAARKPRNGKGPFVPALGPGSLSIPIPAVPTLTFDLPPSPIHPPPPSPGLRFPPEAAPYTVDPEVLKPGVIQDLDEVQNVWFIGPNAQPASIRNDPFLLGPMNGAHPPEFDVLSVLKTTTRAIRSVRNYLLALPDDHPSHQSRNNLIETFRPQSLKRPPYSTRRVVSSPRPSTAPPLPPAPPPATVPLPPDPLSLIRRSALDVLTVLRDLEERSRIPISDDAYDLASMGSAGSGISRTHSPVSFSVEGTATPSVLSGDDDLSDLGGSTRFSSSNSNSASPRPSRLPKSPRPEIVPLKVQGREKAVHVWADPEDESYFEDDEEDTKKDGWDERLVLGGGWLYRSDIDPKSLSRERMVVEKYLDIVDAVLFGNTQSMSPGQRGWQRAKMEVVPKPRLKGRSSSGGDGSPRKSLGGSRRVISAGLLETMNELTLLTAEPKSMLLPEEDEDDEEETEVEDDALPEWAKRSRFQSDPLARLHSFLIHHLPANLLTFLPMTASRPPSPPSDPTNSHRTDSPPKLTFRENLLTTLSDGQLLCVAYNAVVRKSSKPWGYIHLENVHDLLGLTDDDEDTHNLDAEMILGGTTKTKSKTNWTFRRTENLRYWSAALKLRYMIPIVSSPPNVDATPTKGPHAERAFADPVTSPLAHFDPKVVAGHGSGWEDMFEATLFRWLEVVLSEKRGTAF